MAFRKILCPNCGKETKINDEKEINFCLECGAKIAPQGQTPDTISQKLEEVAFYYQVSQEKNEYMDCNTEPVYYLKAQDLLVDLSEQYSDDYRIWWELSKPIDYGCQVFDADACLQYAINEEYFGKALDCAELSTKKELIAKHDEYVSRKDAFIHDAEKKRMEIEDKQREEADAKRRELEKQEEERRKAEAIQREKEIEERRKAEAIQREKEIEAKREAERIKKEKNEQKKAENEGRVMAVLSLAFGIISLCTFGVFIIPEIVGIVFAFKGKKQGIMRGMAKAGLVCSCISIVILVGLFCIIIWG